MAPKIKAKSDSLRQGRHWNKLGYFCASIAFSVTLGFGLIATLQWIPSKQRLTRTLATLADEAGALESRPLAEISIGLVSNSGSGGNNNRVENDIRMMLRHGVTTSTLQLLNELKKQPGITSWSHGRVCWYLALCHYADGEFGEALKWGELAKRAGIPELAGNEREFWIQFENWGKPVSAKSFSTYVSTSSSDNTLHLVSMVSRKETNVENAKQIVDEIRRGKTQLGKASEEDAILAQIRLATWELLLGEYTAFHDSLSLWTTSIDSFIAGKNRLDEIEAKIGLSPELEDTISQHPEIAIRLDSARVRLVAIQNKEVASREKEVARLHQLRNIARDYRSLCEVMLDWQMYQALLDPDKSAASASESLAQLKRVFDEVDSRRDFHLFDDEPALEGDSEFNILQVNTAPISSSALSLMKSLQGYTYLQVFADSQEDNPELLAKAKAWAKAALNSEDSIADLPEGSDPQNMIAKLVLGMVEAKEGQNSAFSPSVADRKEAEQHFDNARSELTGLATLIQESAYADTTQLPSAVQEVLSELKDVGFAKSEAEEHLRRRQPASARASLISATKIHRDADTALQAIDFGLRTGLAPDQLLQEWEQYVAIGIFTDDNPVTRLAEAKILNRKAGSSLLNSKQKDHTQLLGDLKEVAGALSRWSDDSNLAKDLQSAIKANHALSIAYRWALESTIGKSTLAKSEIESAYRHAKDAEFFLQRQLENIQNEEQGLAIYTMREALVASRIAAGHLAALYLDDWRDESKIFFTAATAEAAKLNGTSPVLPLVGEPLLRQFFDENKGGNLKLANEERQRRQMVTRCLEAMFTSRFGKPDEGAEQMDQAVKIGIGTAAGSTNLRVTDLSAGADGFDAKATLPDTIRAFSVLADIEAKQFSRAFGKAISLSSKDRVQVTEPKSLTLQQSQECIESIESPLIAFTYAKAIQAFISNLPPTQEIELREWLSQQALESSLKGKSMLDAERLSVRYPHLVSLIDDAITNLREPDVYRSRTMELIAEQRFTDAIAVASSGVALHPTNQGLWNTYFSCRIRKAEQLGDDARTGLRGLVQEMDEARHNNLLNAFDAVSGGARILEILGAFEEAEQRYRIAEDLSSTPSQRISAVSNAERLRVIVAGLASDISQQSTDVSFLTTVGEGR